ncbi:MAG: DNA-3-methyladenine glycosylase 2 family protein [Clostridia bacterium]|nr:DNA-3-methyladenine glycosylase 2 family protein [Clostridia bacterium]
MGNGYEYKFDSSTNTVTLTGVEHFDAGHTFLCGQCFRFDQEDDGSFTGVAHGKVINVKTNGTTVQIRNCTEEDFKNLWERFLGLDTDYGAIKESLSGEEHIDKAMEFGWGIRLLNQEPFECLISFVISTQNQIPRIKKIIRKMCELFGDKITFDGKDYYTFPNCHKLASLTEEDLAPINAGYRTAYILDAAKKVASGEIDLDIICALPTDKAKAELMKIKGVGPKVADCTMLFSLQKGDAFPVDVWVQRIVRQLYLGENASIKEISAFAGERFGMHSGIAQQYLFFYARENG